MLRIGHGYDVHKLVEGRKLIIGGVEIPYEKVCSVIPMQMCFFTQSAMRFSVQLHSEISAVSFPTTMKSTRAQTVLFFSERL